jgi:hypothetical protein
MDLCSEIGNFIVCGGRAYTLHDVTPCIIMVGNKMPVMSFSAGTEDNKFVSCCGECRINSVIQYNDISTS